MARRKKAAEPVEIALNQCPGWVAIFIEETPSGVIGTSLKVDGFQDRWFDARAEAVRQLTAKLGRTVSQDSVEMQWAGT